MKVYLIDPINSRLLFLLKKMGVECLTKKEDFASSPHQILFSFFEQFDALIVEATQPTQEIMYLLAQAILQGKPTLCYYQKNREPRQLLGFLRRPEAKNIITKAYTRNTIENIVLSFINILSGTRRFKEKPTIRFTLRLTSAIERYLNWKIQGKDITKADFLREMVEKEINKDEKYQAELKKG